MASTNTTKRADLGQADDGAFEQTFSSMAHSLLAARAPVLLEYEVGFELLDRDEDDTRACGIFGFNVNGSWLYAPIFFSDGDLKGADLLYVKDQDRFVPLKENWVNYLLSKRPPQLGSAVERNGRDLGVSRPDLTETIRSPYKAAAASLDPEIAARARVMRQVAKAAGVTLPDVPDWALVGGRLMAKAAKAVPDLGLRLPALIASGGVKLARALKNHLDLYPTLRAPLAEFYPAADLERAFDAVKSAAIAGAADARDRDASRRRKRAAALRGLARIGDAPGREKLAVTVLKAGAALPLYVGRDDAPRLARDRVLVKDAREDDEVSHAVGDVDVMAATEQAFTNPRETGVYDLMLRDNTFARALITINPTSEEGNEPIATVVRLGGDGARPWFNAYPDALWVKNEPSSWRDDFEEFPRASGSSVSHDSRYLVVGPRGEASVPFEVLEDLGSRGEGKAYAAYFTTSSRFGNPPSNALSGLARAHRPRVSPGTPTVELGRPEGSKFTGEDSILSVPAGFRIVTLARSQYDAGFEPGDLLDLRNNYLGKRASLSVLGRGDGYLIEGSYHPEPFAVARLVAEVGLREDAARAILKTAHASRYGPVAPRVHVKLADGYRVSSDMTAPEWDPDDMGNPTPIWGDAARPQGEAEHFLKVQGLDEERPDPLGRDAPYDAPDPQAMQVADQAAQSGQKDVFDSAMIGSLLKATRDDQLIDQNVGPIMKSIDAKGRLLFGFYHQRERFADRYGEASLGELEESLRNAFNSDGDLGLFLKTKSIDANPDESMASTDLDDIAIS